MTENPEEEQERRQVADPDDRIDRKIKDRVVESRNRIDKAEEEFFVNELGQIDPQNLSRGNRQQYEQTKRHFADRWGVLVRQYIRAVKPLLTSDEVPKSEQYWSELPVYKAKFSPPDESDYAWSRFGSTDNPMKVTQRMGLPPSFDPPEAKPVKIIGLKNLMNTDRLSLSWHIDPTPDKLPPAKDDRYLDIDQPLPKEAYENAVELTDDFLDQAGIGLGIEESEPDDGFLDL